METQGVCVCLRSTKKKVIQVWDDMRVSSWWENFLFWVNGPFNMLHAYSTASSWPFDYSHTNFAFITEAAFLSLKNEGFGTEKAASLILSHLLLSLDWVLDTNKQDSAVASALR